MAHGKLQLPHIAVILLVNSHLRLQVPMVVREHLNTKLMKFYFYLFCFVFFIACNGKKSLKTDVDELYAAIPKDTLKELLSIAGFPDSTLTSSQLATKKKINKLLEEHLTVVDNQFVLLAEPKDFEKVGLSKYYYIMYKKSLNDTNREIDSLGIQNLDEKFKKGSIEKGYTLFYTEEEK
jgi:hypothetical protein